MPCKISLAKCAKFCCVSSYLAAFHTEAYSVEGLSLPFLDAGWLFVEIYLNTEVKREE